MFVSHRLKVTIGLVAMMTGSLAFGQEWEGCSTYEVSMDEYQFADISCIATLPSTSDATTATAKITIPNVIRTKAHAGMLLSSQMNQAYEPTSVWNLEVEFPFFFKNLTANVSFDNPALGKTVVSKLIQPARTSYSSLFTLHNINIGKQEGIRIIYYHQSDHQVDSIEPFKNNQFHSTYESGSIDSFMIEKGMKRDLNVSVGALLSSGNFNIARILDVPGYVLTDVSSTGIIVKADKSFKLTTDSKLFNNAEIKTTTLYAKDFAHKKRTVATVSNGSVTGQKIRSLSGDIAAGAIEISSPAFKMGQNRAKISLTATGSLPVTNLHKATSLEVRTDANGNETAVFYNGTPTGAISLGLVFYPFFSEQ